MKIEEISLLLDFYGDLLPGKQREFLRFYHEENYSLAEIGEEFQVTRQGVYDGVKKAQSSLRAYEEKLGLVREYKQTVQLIAEAKRSIESICEERKGDADLVKKLRDIQSVLSKLE